MDRDEPQSFRLLLQFETITLGTVDLQNEFWKAQQHPCPVTVSQFWGVSVTHVWPEAKAWCQLLRDQSAVVEQISQWPCVQDTVFMPSLKPPARKTFC